MPPLVVALLAGLSIAGFLSLFPARFADFRAFYCSGRVVNTAHDPYREHPLHECEHGLHSSLLSSLPAEITIPAPFPGYTLGLFSIVARLPVEAAIVVWTLCSGAALLGSIVLVARLTAVPFYASVIALGFPACIVALPLGQPTTFVLLAIATCATMLRTNRPRLGAIAAVFAALDPRAGIVVCLSLVIGVPQTRLTIFWGLLALAVLSSAILGLGREWEYVHDVLPLHALVNVPEFSQFSVTNLAFTAGLNSSRSLLLGNIWYAASIVVGIATGLRLRLSLGPSALALVPVAFVVFGGTHTHLQQLALALPAFMLVAANASGSRRRLFIFATFVASVPWLIAAPFPYLILGTATVAVAFARVMNAAELDARLGATAVTLLALFFVAVLHASNHAAAPASAVNGNPLAEVAWGGFVSRTFLPLQTWYIVAKLPTLLSFVVMLGALLDAAFFRNLQAVRVSVAEGKASRRLTA